MAVYVCARPNTDNFTTPPVLDIQRFLPGATRSLTRAACAQFSSPALPS